VPKVTEEPPEACGPAGHPLVVGDDEDSRPDSCPRSRVGEAALLGERVPAAVVRWRARRRGELTLDVDERRTGDVAFDVELASTVGVPELPAAVDEPVPHAVRR
jgi:hypothetical protein